MGRASKDKRDMYYRKAKEEGYRARSAYKLLQLHEEFGILRRENISTGVVDLCAAPGSWSQVLACHLRDGAGEETRARRQPPARIVAVDLQEMMPIDGVRLLQGDITSEATAREIIRLLNCDDGALGGVGRSEEEEEEASAQKGESTRVGATPSSSGGSSYDSPHHRHSGDYDNSNNRNANNNNGNDDDGSGGASERKADLVVCDGAPDVTGMHELDEYLQHHLLLAALNITTFVLRRGGTFVTKMFRGPNTPFLVAKSEIFFRHVVISKPKSSRNTSMEAFLVCQDYQPPAGYTPSFDCPLTTTTRCFTPAAPIPPSLLRPADCHPHASAQSPTSTTTRDDGDDEAAWGCRAAGVVVPFLACGDLAGYDADMCYDRDDDAPVLPPVHPPVQAPYLTAGRGAAAGGDAEEAKRRRVEDVRINRT